MAKTERDFARTLFIGWLLCVSAPSLAAAINALVPPLPEKFLMNLAIRLAFVGGCGAALVTDHRWPGRVVAVVGTVVIVLIEVFILGQLHRASIG